MNGIFNFSTAGSIIMGVGALKKLGSEARKLGGKKVFIITDEGIAKAGILEKVKGILEKEGFEVGYFDKVIPEPPIDTVEDIAEAVKQDGYNLLIGLGGGSSIDATKAVSILVTNGGPIDKYVGTNLVEKPGLPTIMLPTTSGTGSEVTPIAILTDVKEELKKGVVSPYLYADVAIVDPNLTITVPPKITANTGMDALIHAIESYIAKKANKFTECISLEAIKLISGSLRTAVADGENIEARYNMSLGSLMAGVAFANAGVGAVHALAYPLGGQFHIPHGMANTLMLRYVMEYNVVSRMEKFAKIAEAMGENIEGLSIREAAQKAIDAMIALAEDIGVPTKLREVDIPEAAIPKLAEAGVKVTRLLSNNPRVLTLEDITQIYTNAW
ncbi:MAG: alcohol dehydrogenase [Thermosediminibacterales bacterium]|nr:alcohol dehydrogenase [Thermosediminibacterales bacterium]MDK2835948.1 alcohol dehydrogenase [Thermosediminibacterales bacterium]